MAALRKSIGDKDGSKSKSRAQAAKKKAAPKRSAAKKRA